MAYKRYFYRNGNKFGPYYYESYRDENGKIKKRYIGTVDPDEKKQEKTKSNNNSQKKADTIPETFVSETKTGKTIARPTQTTFIILIVLFLMLILTDCLFFFYYFI